MMGPWKRFRRQRGQSRAKRFARDERGQMTIELLVVLPVMLIIALIVFNALTFFGLCAEYDRVARNAVRVYAAAPNAADAGSVAAEVSAAIDASLDCPTAESMVEGGIGTVAPATFTCELAYRPTLFGLGLRDEIFGVPLPALRHRIALSTFSYDPVL